MNPTIISMLNALPDVNIRLENAQQIEDMTWFDFSGSNESLKIIYIFRAKQDELLLAKNGRVMTGEWQFISNTNSLLIKQGNRHDLYNAILFEGHYLVLKQDGSLTPMLLINQAYYQRILEVAPKSVDKLIIRDLEKLMPVPEVPSIETPIIEIEPEREEVNTEVEELVNETQEEFIPESRVEEELEKAEEVPVKETVIEDSTTESFPEEIVEEIKEDLEESLSFNTEETIVEETIVDAPVLEQKEDKKPLSLLEKLRQETGAEVENDYTSEEDEVDEELVYPFGEKKLSLNDKLKQQLHKKKQETLLDKLAGKAKKE